MSSAACCPPPIRRPLEGNASLSHIRVPSMPVTTLGALPGRQFLRESLIKYPTTNCRPELGGIKVFRSIMGPPCSHRNACKKVLQSDDPPTICPLELMPLPLLQASLPTVPRSVSTPLFHRRPWWI